METATSLTGWNLHAATKDLNQVASSGSDTGITCSHLVGQAEQPDSEEGAIDSPVLLREQGLRPSFWCCASEYSSFVLASTNSGDGGDWGTPPEQRSCCECGGRRTGDHVCVRLSTRRKLVLLRHPARLRRGQMRRTPWQQAPSRSFRFSELSNAADTAIPRVCVKPAAVWAQALLCERQTA